MTADDRDPVEALVEEYFRRRRSGDPSDVDQMAARVPDRAAEFKRLVEALDVLETATHQPTRLPALDEPGAPARLGRFRLLRLVGRGGMGSVFEAFDEELSRRVALKVLPGHATLDEREIARFRREAQAAARLRHPHIVPVFGVGEDDGAHWLAMQLVEGESLERVLRRTREPPAGGATSASPMIAREVARHGLAIAEALACAHAEGVLHRDVKPSNLLLDTSGVVWVTDFGLAKSEGTASITRTGETVGTPRYMAPEAFSGWADPRTDVWGVGATLYELLAGRPAFDGGDRAQLLKQISIVEPPSLRSLDPSIPRDLATIVHKCLQKEPAARYGTARELADDLRRFVAGEPILARPPSLAYRAGLVVRRHRVAAASALATVVVLFVLLVAWGASLDSKNAKLSDANARAAESLRIANDAINNIYAAVAGSALSREPSLDPMRRRILEEALTFELQLLEQHPTDWKQRLDVANQHRRVAAIDWELGRQAEGDEHCARAEAILRELLAERPDSPEALLSLSEVAAIAAMLARERGDLARAVVLSRESLERREALVASEPDDFFIRCRLVHAAALYCDVSTRDRRPIEGVRVVRSVLERMTPTLVMEPAGRNPQGAQRDAQTALRAGWFWASVGEMTAGASAAAMECVLHALDCSERLEALGDSPVVDAQVSAFLRSWVAFCELRLGRLEAASVQATRACADLERFAALYTTNANARCDLAVALAIRCQIELERDPEADVEPTMRRALTLAEQAAADCEPASPMRVVGLQLRADLGTLREARGDRTGAREHFIAGTEASERCLADRSKWSSNLVGKALVLWYDRAYVELALGEADAAASSALRGLELADWLLGGDGACVSARQLRAKCNLLLGSIRAARGDRDDAYARWAAAQAEVREVLSTGGAPIADLARQSEFTELFCTLVRALNLDANERARNGDRPGARQRLEEAIEAAQLLAEGRPQDSIGAAVLGTARADRGQVADMDGEAERARAEFQIALPLLGDAVRRRPHDAPTRHALAVALDWFAASFWQEEPGRVPEGLDGFIAIATAAADAAPRDPEVQYGVARVLAHGASCRHTALDGELAPARDPWSDAAMERLRAASDSGYRNVAQARRDDAFDALKPREDFQRWLEELTASSR